MWEAFFKEMEKKAFVMPALMGAATVWDVSSQLKEQDKKNTLLPLKQHSSSYKLPSSRSFDFEGGKRMGRSTALPSAAVPR